MATSTAAAKRRELRSAMERWRQKQDALAWSIFLLDAALWVAAEVTIVAARSWPWQLLAGAAASVLISRLFICGHDACHGSFVTSSRMNRLIGRIAFLPSLTPYSLWEAGHNVVHHSFTNLKGRDWVWVPMTVDEYRSAPALRRAAERFYRGGWLGFGAYYAIELWWRRMILPDRRLFTARRTEYLLDRMLVTGFLLMHASCLYGAALYSGQDPLWIEVTGQVIPFLLWNMTMGFVIYHHHTHPSIAWFDNREEWTRNTVQLRNSLHVLFPGPFNFLLHRIMDHTAHHVDVGVPLYHLPEAQTELEAMEGEQVIVQQWSLQFFRSCTAMCQLYDYRTHCWLDFEGNVTAKVTRLVSGDNQ